MNNTTTTTDVSHPLRLTHIVREGSNGVEKDILLGDNVRVTAGRGKRAFGHIPLNFLDTMANNLEERYKFTAFTISSDADADSSDGHVDPAGVSVQRIKKRDDSCVVELKLFRRGWFVSVVLQVEDLVTGKVLNFLSETFNAHNNGKEKSISEKLRQAQEKKMKKTTRRPRRSGGSKKRSSRVAFEEEPETTEVVALPRQKRPCVASLVSSPEASLPPAPDIVQPWPQRAVSFPAQSVQDTLVARAILPETLEIDASIFGGLQQQQHEEQEEEKGKLQQQQEEQQANEDVGDLVLELGELMEQDPGFASDFTQFLDAESINNAQNSIYPDVATLSWRFPQFGSFEPETQPGVPVIRTGSAMWDAISMPNNNDMNINYLDFQQPIAVEQGGLFLQE